MIKTPEDMMKLHNEVFQASSAAFAKTMENMQKLAELNMQTAKASMEESADLMKAMMAAKDVQVLAKLMTEYAKNSPESMAAYTRALYAISKESGGEFAEMVEQQMAAGREQMNAAIEALAKSAPTGSEGAIGFMKQAMSAADTAFEQARAATTQFVKVAEANVEKAAKTTGAASRKR